MKKIEIIADLCDKSDVMIYHLILGDNGRRKRIRTFSEYDIEALCPTIDGVEECRDFVELYASNIAREMCIANVEWNYNLML